MHGSRSDGGFTLVEVMIVVLIIGVLVVIAIPVYSGVTQTAKMQTCFANERTVEGAYHVYLVGLGGSALTFADRVTLMGTLVPNYLKQEPSCPLAGTYEWSDGALVCTVHGHY